MNRTIIIGTLACIVGLMTACNNQKRTDGGDKPTQEIVYNDKIQNTFFGVPFGSSKDEVVAGFAKHDFYEDRYSTNDQLSFNKKDGGPFGLIMGRFSFGGINWSHLYVNMSNNQFYSIDFTNAHKTKESAMEQFESVMTAVSAKYQLFEDPIDDTTSYKRFAGVTKTNQWVLVSCYSYESVSNERYIGVSLAYGDNNFYNVSNEL